MTELKKTYGQQIIEHRAEQHTLDDDVIEYRRQMEQKVLADINGVVDQAIKTPLYANRDFYVVLLFKNERVGEASRTFVFARRSCPTPIYKQAVWKYHANGTLEFLWSIPDKILYWHIYNNSAKYLADKETSDLAKYVILMEDGELLQWVKRENNEKKDAVIKIQENQ